jgi:hypothetical protein
MTKQFDFSSFSSSDACCTLTWPDESVGDNVTVLVPVEDNQTRIDEQYQAKGESNVPLEIAKIDDVEVES